MPLKYFMAKLLTRDLRLCRWQPTPQTRRMLNPRGPKTERGNAAGHESGNVKPHRHANATVLVNEIALNLQKGNKNAGAQTNFKTSL